jgi:NADH-quinone oxidoreductase subunit K
MGSDIPLTWFLYFAAAAFSIGLVGVLVRRNAIAVLMAIPC